MPPHWGKQFAADCSLGIESVLTTQGLAPRPSQYADCDLVAPSLDRLVPRNLKVLYKLYYYNLRTGTQALY